MCGAATPLKQMLRASMGLSWASTRLTLPSSASVRSWQPMSQMVQMEYLVVVDMGCALLECGGTSHATSNSELPERGRNAGSLPRSEGILPSI